MSDLNKMELAEWTLDQTLKAGADQAAVRISTSREIEFAYRDKQLEKLQESLQNGLTINIYAKQRYSSHSTNDMRRESIKKLIDEAIASTMYLSPDEFRTLPDPEFYPKTKGEELEIRDNSYEAIDSVQRKKFASDIESAAMAVSDKIISASSGYSDTYGESVLINSNGFSGESVGTQFSAGAEVTVRDGETGRPEDWYYATTRFQSDLPSANLLGEKAAQKALAKIGQKKMESGVYDMVIENRAGTRLIGMLTGPMGGRALQLKSSYLDGMLDQKVASEVLTIYDDPTLKRGLGSRHFDSEGLAAIRRPIIEKGILRGYFIDTYYGKKLNMIPNSGSSSNLIFMDGSAGLDEMIAGVKNGILVTGFIGGNSNDTTGDFSYGIVGRLIENGQLTQPVNEMNISGNGKEFWNKLAVVGNDAYQYSSRMMPSLWFKDIQFSGI